MFLGTTDSTPLLNSDDEEGAEAFLLSLFGSPALSDAGIERIVLQHMGEDDDGPLVFTLTALLSDLQTAVDTGADAFESIAIQVERP